MIRLVHDKVWAFDVEWIPDPDTGRLLYDLPPEMSDEEVMKEMWSRGGATEEDPMPYLKTTLCRVVSLSVVTRHKNQNSIEVKLRTLPSLPLKEEETKESFIIKTFLDALGTHKPQIVGYNSVRADLMILVQRGIANGIEAGSFASRPGKPWEGTDYFSERNEMNVDLMRVIGGWGRSVPSLHEIAVVSGIPGKMGVDGKDVAPLWLRGEIEKIIAYNEYDALTTYLLWLRVAHFAGFFDKDAYEYEQKLVREMIKEESEKNGKEYLLRYLEEWDRLKKLRNT